MWGGGKKVHNMYSYVTLCNLAIPFLGLYPTNTLAACRWYIYFNETRSIAYGPQTKRLNYIILVMFLHQIYSLYIKLLRNNSFTILRKLLSMFQKWSIVLQVWQGSFPMALCNCQVFCKSSPTPRFSGHMGISVSPSPSLQWPNLSSPNPLEKHSLKVKNSAF